MEKLAAFLVREQKVRNLNETDMAELIGIGQATYSRLINMRIKDPKPSTMRLIIAKLGANIGMFLENANGSVISSLSPIQEEAVSLLSAIEHTHPELANAVVTLLRGYAQRPMIPPSAKRK